MLDLRNDKLRDGGGEDTTRGREDYVIKPIRSGSFVPRIQSLLEVASRAIKGIVADNQTMGRKGICVVLALQKGIEVIGEAVDSQDALEKVL